MTSAARRTMVDRALTQFRYSGLLDGVAGVALGSIDHFAGYEDRGWTIVDTLRDHFDALNVFVLGGLPSVASRNSPPCASERVRSSMSTADA